MVKGIIQFGILFLITGLITVSCNKDIVTTNPDAKLEFTTDTLSFDTVFTSIGSTTQWFKAINRNKQAINISRIFLAGGNSSPFRLNINGIESVDESDVKIEGNDSLFIFVEVTIDPTGQNNPMVISDSVVFEVNGNVQDVNLIAFGQDFHLLNGDVIESQHWVNDKPYLIYNSVLVDSLKTLTIDPGCRIHFHKGSSMFVKGTLNVNGTFEEPVTFGGDRLEGIYKDVPGQWGATTILGNNSLYVFGGIHFLLGSRDNTINYAVIKNAYKGIQIDSMGFSENPMLTLTNSRIENMTLNCIDARTTSVRASNCIFANSGSYTVALLFGGDYEFYHCTLANYYYLSNRNDPTLILNNFYKYNGDTYSFDLTKADFGNCIIYGNNETELGLENAGTGTFNYLFQNCLLKTGGKDNLKGPGFPNTIYDKDPLFVNIGEHNYAIDSLSPARNVGDLDIAKRFPTDLDNNSRLADEGPDLGALEWIPTEKRKK